MTKSPQKPIFHKARLEDIDAVHLIERAQFPHPTQKRHFISELSNEIARFYICRLPGAEPIAGFFICWVIEETMELHDIATAPQFQGQGVGAAMMSFILEMAKKEQVEKIFLEVRASNSRAIEFYKRFNFLETGRRKGYYLEPVEDALIFFLPIHS